MQKVILILVACVFATANIVIAATKNTPVASSGSGKKIVKWVDSKGVTQYGDKLPAQEAGRNNSEMNGQGRVVKQNVAGDKKNEVADQQKIEQDRKDKILLASYTKPEEIDLARDRNLQMDQAALQALNQHKATTAGRTARNSKAAEGFRARKKPVPQYLSDELRLAKLEFARIDKQLTQRKLSMENTHKRYAEEKARFVALKQTTNIAAPPQDTKALTAKLDELNNWKYDVERRINATLEDQLQRKRRGESVGSSTYKQTENSLASLLAELRRAEEEIATTKIALAATEAIINGKGT